MVVGLYFGSFNPVHQGHIQLAKSFQEQSGVDQVWWVLSPQNPFKSMIELASFEHRLNMLQLILPQDHALCTIEKDLSLPSYTIQTLQALEEKYPQNQWKILMGQDSWNSLPTWKDGRFIEENYSIWVYPRISETSSNLRSGAFHLVLGDWIDVSSTSVRSTVSNSNVCPAGLDVRVWDYIQENQLYRPLI